MWTCRLGPRIQERAGDYAARLLPSKTPTSMVQKGKFAAWAAPFFTIALKSVDLPTFGSPTIPVLRADEETFRLKIMQK